MFTPWYISVYTVSAADVQVFAAPSSPTHIDPILTVIDIGKGRRRLRSLFCCNHERSVTGTDLDRTHVTFRGLGNLKVYLSPLLWRLDLGRNLSFSLPTYFLARLSGAMDRNRSLQAAAIMREFGERSGLTTVGLPTRYLWTDAFAVCNWLALGENELALRLIDQVHHTLGRHRNDDPRRGWLSGLDDRSGEAHPTIGGLRIGKDLPERSPEDRFDERLEWDRDGQYFHYLTKWIHALDQTTRYTGLTLFHGWARELAAVAHRAFTYSTAGALAAKRMYWKMSIDLSRPLVTSMGHHDPLDGYVTCAQLDATAQRFPEAGGPDIAEAAADFAAMVPHNLASPDPLGLGGLLADAFRVDQLIRRGVIPGKQLLRRILSAAADGLPQYAHGRELDRPAEYRLAFRELGLAIGLSAVPMLSDAGGENTIAELRQFLPLRDEIESFWLHSPHRRTASWNDHRNINDVMLATSLVPQGYLVLR